MCHQQSNQVKKCSFLILERLGKGIRPHFIFLQFCPGFVVKLFPESWRRERDEHA